MVRWDFWRSLWRPRLSADVEDRLRHWERLPPVDLHIPLDDASFVVVDVETTGLDPARDSLVSIGAVRLRGSVFDLGTSFHGILVPERKSSRENILIHGITPGRQARGEARDVCLVGFLEFCGPAPLLAFNAAFDRAFLKRAIRRTLGASFRNPFLDLAWILPAVFPSAPPKRSGLDEWTEHFHLQNMRRHTADADAVVTAELALAALDAARRRGVRDAKALYALASRTAKLAPAGPQWSV